MGYKMNGIVPTDIQFRYLEGEVECKNHRIERLTAEIVKLKFEMARRNHTRELMVAHAAGLAKDLEHAIGIIETYNRSLEVSDAD